MKRNISHTITQEKQKNIKEWQRVTSHLKELKDEDIPSSQSIDYISSEDEKETSVRSKNSLMLLKSGGKYNLKERVNKEEFSTGSSKEPSNSPIFKSKLKETNSQNFWNSLSTHSERCISKEGPHNICLASSGSISEVCSYNQKKSEGSSSEPILSFHIPGQFSPVLKISPSPVLKPNLSPVYKSKHSPILKSKLRIKRLKKVFDSREKQVVSRNIFSKNCDVQSESNSTSLECFPIRINNITDSSSLDENHLIENDCNEFKSSYIKDSEYDNYSDNEINSNVKSNKLLNVAIKELSFYKLFQDENKFDITNCFSPKKDQMEEVNSSTPSINSQKSEEALSCLGDTTSKKGSDWVKTLQSLTPEKNNDFHDVQPSELDSVKKKFKKNGFADQLRKLVQSWQSNVSMWNHQMSLASINQDISCSLSPLPVSKKNSEVGQSFQREKLLKYHINESQLPVISSSEKKYPGQDFSLLEDPFSVYKDKPSKSPLPTCIRNLRNSLESSNESSVGNSAKKTFTLPKKHICVKLLKIEYQTAVMISALCKELDKCSLKALNVGPNEKMSRIIMAIFGVTETKPDKVLKVGSVVTIYAPWQSLEIVMLPYPLLFSTYFVIRSIDSCEQSCRIPHQEKEEMRVASWECDCLSGSNPIPPTCQGGKLKVHLSDEILRHLALNISRAPLQGHHRSFSTIKDSKQNSSPKRDRFWTIIEAIEQCGGMPDISISLTIRIKRIFSIRTTANPVISHYLILGQDPDGTFAVVEVPNRPLKSTLRQMLDEGLDTTRTLTHLTVKQRIVDSEDPELFSLINSLQIAYKDSLTKNAQLLPLLKDHLKKPLQSFCYKFIVNLGQTLEFKIPETNILNVSLPHWTLEDISELKENGRRGKISVVILYRFYPYLYVTCRNTESLLKRCSESVLNHSYGIYRIMVKNSTWLPPWVNCDGTIMVSVCVEDVVLWKGALIVDTFCRLLRLGEEVTIDRNSLISIIPPLSVTSEQFDLITFEGVVKRVIEEKSRVWEECNICGGFSLYRITPRNTKCQACYAENISPIKKYSLEVEVRGTFLPSEERKMKVRVTLFQTTIRNLLKSVTSKDSQYKMEDVIGASLGPLICCLKAVENKRRRKTLFAVELPY